MQRTLFCCTPSKGLLPLSVFESGRSMLMPVQSSGHMSGRQRTNFIKTVKETRMTYPVSRRSLLALGAGLGASTMLGGSALAKAPKLGTQPSYF
jgi:hypothetical protein